MKVMITGSRVPGDGIGIDVYRELDELHTKYQIRTLLSGGARGVDQIGERWARERGVELVVYKPDYKRYRRAAPRVRSAKMIGACDGVVAFWNGTSKRTGYVLGHARSKLLTCIQY